MEGLEENTFLSGISSELFDPLFCRKGKSLHGRSAYFGVELLLFWDILEGPMVLSPTGFPTSGFLFGMRSRVPFFGVSPSGDFFRDQRLVPCALNPF